MMPKLSHGYASTRRLFLLSLLFFFVSGETFSASAWTPTRNVEIIVPASPGGGIDVTVRSMQRITQDHRLLPVTTTVVNKPGGGGGLGLSYLGQHPDDAHRFLVIAPNLLTNSILRKGAPKHTDFTPLALLFDQYVVVSVSATSPIRTAAELVSRLKTEPSALSVGIATSLGNFNHMAVALALKAAGGDPKALRVVVFNSSADSITALLGGHIDVVASSALNILPLFEAQKIRPLALASSKRLTGELAGVPTFTELGIKSVVGNWRVVLGAKGITEAQVNYWEGVFEQLSRTPEWRRELQKNLFVDTFMKSDETRRYLNAQYEELKEILMDLGLAK